jgi:alkylated DNA repair dioxygenase AlkB
MASQSADPWNYIQNVITNEQSEKYYEVFKNLVRKDKADIMIFGKMYKEQRYKNFFSKDGHSYKYSATNNESVGWPKEIQELADLAKETIGCDKEFDSALVNYYPDGDHVVGKHNDKDAMHGYIASFSFGAPRRFHIRDPDKIYKTYLLEDRSLFVMEPGMQQKFKHELPKMASVKTGRINVTLRQQQGLKRDAPDSLSSIKNNKLVKHL